jgi:hypothetical protein
MPVNAFLSNLTRRKSERSEARASMAVSKCPVKTGDVLIGVFNSLTMDPLGGVATKLDGVGAKPTDDMGIAAYLEVDPKEYKYSVTYGADYEAWERSDEAGSVGVSGNSVAVVQSSAWAAGKINVTVKLKHQDGRMEVLPGEDVLSIVAGETVEKMSQHVFSSVALGEHRVTVKVDPAKYGPTELSQTVVVKANETNDIEFVVEEVSWITIKIHDVDAKKDLGQGEVVLTLPDGSESSFPLADEGARCEFKSPGGKVAISSITTGASEEDPIYELVEVTS